MREEGLDNPSGRQNEIVIPDILKPFCDIVIQKVYDRVEGCGKESKEMAEILVSYYRDNPKFLMEQVTNLLEVNPGYFGDLKKNKAKKILAAVSVVTNEPEIIPVEEQKIKKIGTIEDKLLEEIRKAEIDDVFDEEIKNRGAIKGNKL